MRTILIGNGRIVTMNPRRDIIKGDILIKDDRIADIGASISSSHPDRIIDARNRVIIPGLIQTHIHLTQTIFRGQADDLELLDWLEKKIWPLEAAHDAESNYYSAKLGISELIRGGTTTIIDMETVHYTHEAICAIYESGIRAVTGKCMMDRSKGVPIGLRESTESSIRESVSVLKHWHMKDGGRIRYAFNPRFAVSCSEKLLESVRDMARYYGVFIHTHAAENKVETELVRKESGMGNVEYLNHIGLTGPNLILAHCIWLDDKEMKIIAESGTKVSHCPNSNLKLASGVAKVPELLDMGAYVSLGADGAPCNNNLDIFREMRTAALIHKARLLNPTTMPAARIFEMATLGGARAIGQESEIGSIEIGKKADLVIIDVDKVHSSPGYNVDLMSSLVYSASSGDVATTIVNGRILMEDKKLTTLNTVEIRRNSNRLIKRLLEKAGGSRGA